VDDNIDPSLLDDYILLDLAPVVSDAELEEVPPITLTNNSLNDTGISSGKYGE